VGLLSKKNPAVAFWPSAQEKNLLRAALLRGEAAQQAAERWLAGGMDNTREQQFGRLFPLLHQNLKAHSVVIDDSLAKLLKQKYLQTWGTNKLLFHTLAEILGLLHQAEIPALLLKGCALTPACYDDDYGLRPMNDVDIVVPATQVTEAIRVLDQKGWQPEERGVERFTEDYMSISHSHAFRMPGSYECDLHWHLLPECCRAEDDADFWQASLPIEIEGIPTRILNPADQILHLCLHGARWNHKRSVHWLADVMMVLRSKNIDWPRLIHQLEKRRLVVPVRETLNYLVQHLDAPVPAEIMQQLNAAPVSRMEQWEFSYQLDDHDQKPLGYLPILWFHYRRWSGNVGLGRQLAGFPDYLRRFWGVDNNSAFFRTLLSMIQRRF
jgi:hypothetical protein